MAIDTRSKRQNAAQVGCPLPVSIYPTIPNTAVLRAQSSWTYITTAAPPPTGTALDELVSMGTIWGGQIRSVDPRMGGL